MNKNLDRIVEEWIVEYEKKEKKSDWLFSNGNTRNVHEFIPGYVIKESTDFSDSDGIYSNEMEYRLYQMATESERKILNPTIGIYKNGRYIVSKECFPLDYYILESFNEDIEILENFKDIEDFIKEFPSFNVNINDVSNFCLKYNIDEGEFRLISNWGILDNKLVCIDYN